MYQNNPNPFTDDTEINYHIPLNAIEPKIFIHDLNGTEIKCYNLNQRGNGKIIIKGSELKAGMYIYTLIVNNIIINSKKMLLAKN